jgi:hypothetical protein
MLAIDKPNALAYFMPKKVLKDCCLVTVPARQISVVTCQDKKPLDNKSFSPIKKSCKKVK